MKNLCIIAMLLLGLAACSDRKEDVQSPETTTFSWPHKPIKNHCQGCGYMNDWRFMCVNLGNDADAEWNTYCMQFSLKHDRDPIHIINDMHPGGPAAPDLDTNKAGELRDSLLTHQLGINYATYYGYIGFCMMGNGIPLLDLPEHYDFALATYAVADSLYYGSPSCVPITSAYRTDALAMIAYWRLKCDDPIFQATLDSITSDLNTYTGLTKTQLAAYYY